LDVLAARKMGQEQFAARKRTPWKRLLRRQHVFRLKELASASFIGAKFNLSGHFMYRFHTNFAIVNL